MEWISVKDRLPEYKKRVILYAPSYSGRPIFEGILKQTDESGNVWEDAEKFIRTSITHWQSLPEPPKE